jgi:hypothetical protein
MELPEALQGPKALRGKTVPMVLMALLALPVQMELPEALQGPKALRVLKALRVNMA